MVTINGRPVWPAEWDGIGPIDVAIARPAGLVFVDDPDDDPDEIDPPVEVES